MTNALLYALEQIFETVIPLVYGTVKIVFFKTSTKRK